MVQSRNIPGMTGMLCCAGGTMILAADDAAEIKAHGRDSLSVRLSVQS